MNFALPTDNPRTPSQAGPGHRLAAVVDFIIRNALKLSFSTFTIVIQLLHQRIDVNE